MVRYIPVLFTGFGGSCEERRTSKVACAIWRKYVDGKLTLELLVTTPTYSEKGFYQQAVSWSSFQTREVNRVFGPEAWAKKAHLTATYTSIDWAATEDQLRKLSFSGDLEAAVRVTSVWEAYKLIGYDYKKQKYV